MPAATASDARRDVCVAQRSQRPPRSMGAQRAAGGGSARGAWDSHGDAGDSEGRNSSAGRRNAGPSGQRRKKRIGARIGPQVGVMNVRCVPYMLMFMDVCDDDRMVRIHPVKPGFGTGDPELLTTW